MIASGDVFEQESFIYERAPSSLCVASDALKMHSIYWSFWKFCLLLWSRLTAGVSFLLHFTPERDTFLRV